MKSRPWTICPKPGHLVRARNRSDLESDVGRNTALVVAARGVEVQVMINGRLAWVRRALMEVVYV